MMPPPSAQTPLLPTTTTTTVISRRTTRRPPSLTTTVSNYLRGVNSRGLMRDLPMRVRESATEHVIEQRQTGWDYTASAVIFDLVYNLVFIVASICIMITSVKEAPGVHLRVWIVGYAMQCCVHVGCVSLEYKKKWDLFGISDAESSEAARDENSGSGEDVNAPNRDGEQVVEIGDGEDGEQTDQDEEGPR